MSLIANALKTAQRERQRHDTGSTRSASPPLLVALKGRAEPRFSWKRALALGLIGAATFAVVWLGMQRLNSPRTIKTPLPLLVSEIPPVPIDSTPSASRDTQSRAVELPKASAPRPASTPRVATRGQREPTPTAPRVRSAREAAAAVLQAQQKTEGPPPAAGALRIAVEQPRGEDVVQLFAMGVAAHRAGDLVNARIAYERVLSIAPRDVDALNNMGVLLSALREFDRAEQLLRRAIALSPRNAGAWNNLGTVLRERGQPSDAIAAFQYALSIDPEHQGARVSLAQQFLAIGSLPQARQILEEVLAANPAVPEAQYALGQVLELQGDKAGALRAYGTFIRIAPGRMAAHVDRVRRHIDALNAKTP